MLGKLRTAIIASAIWLKILELAGIKPAFAHITGLYLLQTGEAHISIVDALAIICIVYTIEDWISQYDKK